MRRTYRSKKDTGGALDHKDVIQALDEKSSAFDAFYIQNLKQTKRELSCIGSSNHYGNAANKVRKRKYVKRILKDPEPTVRDSSSHSVFLTPDKSIRVNKAKDLFDQLLDLSSPRQSPQYRSKFAQFPCKQEGKTYTRKKLAKIKKFNCSSSDSLESDKENSNYDSKIQNVTDLQSYELLVEKEKKPNPKCLDESINNIVKNISALNRVKTSIDSAKNSFLDAKHRLTTNIQSPSNSPLCSTPFKEKYRSQSIFKFSPITFGKTDVSPNYVTIVEENDKNDSVVFVEHKPDSFNISVCEEQPPSPVLPLSTNKSLKSEVSKTSSTESVRNVNSSYIPIINDNANDKCNSKNVEISSIEISDFQTTEAEPFLGFSNNKLLENQSINNNEVGIQSQLNDIEPNENESEDGEFEDSQSFIENKPCTEISHTYNNNSLTEIEETENESSYGTCNSEESSRYDDVEAIKVPIVKIEKLSNSILKRYLDKITSCESEQDTESDMSNELDSDDYASFEVTEISRNDDSNKSSNIESENEIVTDEFDRELDSIVTSDKDLNGYNEEERCISFVTTRRRNEINDSLIFGFNNSLESVSSSDCEKTVLSNNDESKIQTSLRTDLEMDSTDTVNPEVLLNVTSAVKDKEDEVTELKGYKDVTDNNDISRFSTITTRKSSKLSRESILDNDLRKSITNDGKPGIVLQPGKKWERSLSIYRRMTMMTDHFDQSILDDEELNTKGRKYRQSVISTMERQDKGSLHNESIISRRSTFVSKPCRSTIRIIKEPNSSRLSLCTSAVSDDLRGFLNEDCDDTIIELSKLSIADSEHEVTVIENFHETSSRVSTARDYVLRRCGQTDAILFDECYPETVLKNCRKIGEGVYGEVFLWRAGDGRARVMKIVPIAGTTKVNGERQKDFQEVISEIVIAMELSALRAPIDEIQREFDEGKSIDALDLHSVENATDVFNKVLAVRCVYGAYPSRLLDLWELYDECNGSENDNPAILPVDQQYIVLELANAGQDLESYEFNSAEQAHALFLQVAFGLAVGEEAFQFEHRDLHWGNVLIAPTDQKFATFVVRGRPYRVARCGVSATIIDYSLSRLSLPLAAAGDAAALYNDLAADDSLFDAVGDYQFQVYRLMRDKLGNDWKNFEPYTNILWLHYTVDKMITALRYKRTNTKIHKHYIAKLKGIKNRLLEYGSAAQFVLTDNEF